MTARASKTPFILLENISGHDTGIGGGFPNRLYDAPRAVITAERQDEVLPAIRAMDAALDAGQHLAGWIGYEAGYALEDRLHPLAPPSSTRPIIWMGVFDGFENADVALQQPPFRAPRFEAGGTPEVSGFAPALDQAAFEAALGRIHDYLLAGDVYQINFTFPLEFALKGAPATLYRQLRTAQPVGFGAFIDTGEDTVISLSPELFVAKEGRKIRARPMKGTAPRGPTRTADDACALALARDEKSRAENLMIVDLLRNDLSRIAVGGSVDVPRLFEVERYRTVLQMTSTVDADVAPDLRLEDLLRGLFPCGSVTGAPKIRAMEIIRELEAPPRGPYTGAIGCMSPDRDFTFSVPIRTLTLTPAVDAPGRWRGSLGIGAGVVADSDPAAEFEECCLKARFLSEPQPDFDLIETLGWTAADGFRRRGFHLDRLAASARFFGFALDLAQIREALDDLADGLDPVRGWRVRLLLGQGGAFALSAQTLAPDDGRIKSVAISRHDVNSADPLLYHKTTARQVYASGLAEARARTGCFEALFVNERGELTEGSFTNLFIERDGALLTPPVSSGLLPGVLRAELLASGRAREAVLTPADIETADRILIGNSLRGLMEARLL